MADVTVYTVGHGNRTFLDLVKLLRSAGIDRLVDIRAYPSSRRHPHFSRGALEPALQAEGIDYRFAGKGLGGHRTPREDSPHVAIEEDAFRGYADHMATPLFRQHAEHLLRIASEGRTAAMCAERRPERCHRRLLSDFLVTRGATVTHVVEEGESVEHVLDPTLRVVDGELIYHGGSRQLGLF